MTSAQSDAHMRLLLSLPVHTHSREEPPEVNKYTGKVITHDTSRRTGKVITHDTSRRNTWLGRSENPK